MGDIVRNQVYGDINQHNTTNVKNHIRISFGKASLAAVVLVGLGAGATIGGQAAIDSLMPRTIAEIAQGTWDCNRTAGSRVLERFTIGISDGTWIIVVPEADGWVDAEAGGFWRITDGTLHVQERGHSWTVAQLPSSMDDLSGISLDSRYRTGDHEIEETITARYSDGVLSATITHGVEEDIVSCAKRTS